MLAIFSGKIIFNFGIPERLRMLRYSIFTGGVVEINGICKEPSPRELANAVRLRGLASPWGELARQSRA